MSTNSPAKHWCFTLNNYTDEDIERLRGLVEQTEYLVFGKEIAPTSGTPHLQGYVCMKIKKRFTQMKALLGETAHIEKKKSTPEKAALYCKKDKDFEEFGRLATGNGAKGAIEDFMADVKAGEYDLKVLRELHPGVCARYSRFVREYIDQHKPVPEIPNHALNLWQAELNQELLKEPNDREIIFVVDKKGNSGKTWFAKYFCRLHDNAQYMEMAKKADMAYSLDANIRYLFVNCTRQQLEFLNYSFLEAVKDGMVFSPKYESGMKMLGKVHVVVLMNEDPNYEALSADRYNIIELNK